MNTNRALSVWLPVCILLVAVVLRFAAWTQAGRFHPDEALFATFARSAALNGDWLLPGALDKPPLSIYATALAMALLVDGEAAPLLPDISPAMGEFAARLPNLFASLAVVALSYRLAFALYRRRRAALLTMALMAGSPFGVVFAPTAFTDGWLLLWLVASLAAVARGRWLWAGLWLGLAFWSKQQALFYLPLVMCVGLLADSRAGRWRRLLGFGVVLATLALLLALWDSARGEVTGVWALAAANNEPGRLARADEIGPRLATWLGFGGWLLGPPLATLALTALGIIDVSARIVRQARRAASDIVLLAFVAAYTALHWLVAFNIYDRYLLLLLPPLALLAARGLDGLLARRHIRTQVAALGVLVVALMWGGLQAASGNVAFGGDRGEHDGIDAAARYLDSRTLGAIIYDYWLGWELDYYLGEWTDKRRVYYPTPIALAEDALRQPDPAPRYFIAPESQPHRSWLDALVEAGFRVQWVYDEAGYLIYQLLPPWATG